MFARLSRRGGERATRALAAASLAAIATAAAAAPPRVTVRARTAIRLEPLLRVPGGVEVRGELIDPAAREGVPWVDVAIEVDGVPDRATTDERGAFRHRLRVADGVHDLAVRFAGTDLYAPAAVDLRGFDVAKEPLSLALAAPRAVRAGEPAHVRIEARTASGPVAVTVALEVADAGGQPRSAGSATTDDDGAAEAAIAAHVLGAPGRKRLSARFAGDATYDVAAAEADLLVTAGTRLAMDLRPADVAYEDDVEVRGVLARVDGAPLSGAAVTLWAADRPVAEAVTDARGRFSAAIAAAELGSGVVAVQARFDPPEPWFDASRSRPVPVSVREPQPIPMRYTVAAFAAAAAAVVAFALMRARPWEPLLARMRPRGGSDAPRPARPAGPEPVRGGLREARPGLVSTIRRAHDFGLSGTVVDAVTGRPLAGARLELAGPGGAAAHVATDARGAFAIAHLAAGPWRATAAHPGYCSERFTVAIPHRGALRGARIDLVPVRERVFALYREIAEPLLPPGARWGVWTPRQILDAVRAMRPAARLAALTDFVERTYFGPAPPGEEAVESARALGAAARAEASQAVV
ncbi:MAG: carboxypeptidase regulatory-like domain-containing protein [Deltaproteobacteria bacterium]|nr:MAG: carboxypeptidase regulatory-like domain-containing protein [Deltaproteobacteria bacterium]